MEDEIKLSYKQFKQYKTPKLRKRHISRFDSLFWYPSQCTAKASVLEIGCGTGQFMAYLAEKGVEDFHGIDIDESLRDYIPESVRKNFEARDALDFVQDCDRNYDRIVMFDVLEHFGKDEAQSLLKGLSAILSEGGKLLIRVPNLSSPWGLQYHFGDLSHQWGYTPSSMRQLSLLVGLHCEAILPAYSKSGLKSLLDKLVHRCLSSLVASPPDIWTPNFLTIMKKEPH